MRCRTHRLSKAETFKVARSLKLRISCATPLRGICMSIEIRCLTRCFRRFLLPPTSRLDSTQFPGPLPAGPAGSRLSRQGFSHRGKAKPVRYPAPCGRIDESLPMSGAVVRLRKRRCRWPSIGWRISCTHNRMVSLSTFPLAPK